MMANADPLEAFINESIVRSRKEGYDPREFIRMRDTYETVPAIERLVVTGDIQSGLVRLQELNMLEWSIEQAVMNFPDRFTPKARECAKFRLDNINDIALRVR